MKIIRTPDSQFENLTDFDFSPNYTEVETNGEVEKIRIQHIEAGPQDGQPIVLIHGNPTWSYIHRHMVTALGDAGYRAMALDLVGCGRSDKPAEKTDYSLARHVDWITQWFHNNDLSDVTLFCQDWGGHIGLIVAAEEPHLFNKIICANTGLPEGKDKSEFLAMWRQMMQAATEFPWAGFQGSFRKPIDADTIAAYQAPFPDASHMAGILQFPMLIADNSDNPGVPQCQQAWAQLEKFEKPVLTLYGDKDPISKGMDKEIQARIPGSKQQAHVTFKGAGHFIQEEIGDELVPHILNFMKA